MKPIQEVLTKIYICQMLARSIPQNYELNESVAKYFSEIEKELEWSYKTLCEELLVDEK